MRKEALIGYTGFVGSNLNQQHTFSHLYNSKNSQSMRNETFDLVVCAGVRAQKWYANEHPDEDLAMINQLINDLETIKTTKFVLISTIDVYSNPINVNEDTLIDESSLEPYGMNRLYLEKWVINHFGSVRIIRLPGLFGEGIKKNFIYDILNPIPKRINKLTFESRIQSLTKIEQSLLKSYYKLDVNGYELSQSAKRELLDVLIKHNMTSLMFSDHRDRLQYYPLSRLWEDIITSLKADLLYINLAVEPISLEELYHSINPNLEFKNELLRPTQNYNMMTRHDALFNSSNGYILSKKQVIALIDQFIRRQSQ